MKVLCLGGAGRICREATLDLVEFSDFERITVGIPMSIGAQMLARGVVKKTGVLTPEEAVEPEAVFAELRKRHLLVHERVAQGLRAGDGHGAGFQPSGIVAEVTWARWPRLV